ncbi:MAG TPA: CopG family ribbon-helix-helix protein [Methanomicrobia archaeon]|nr:CopG family ribbon-helix-helix protein [Methanomicrobia archaeon]
MTIISVSMDDELLAELVKLQEELGFSGRSEVLRVGAQMLIADCKDKERLEGRLNAVLLLIHAQHVEDAVTAIKHEFEDIIHTQIHNHLREDKCLEVFILEGDAVRVKEMILKFRTTGKMEYVKLVLA